MKFTLLELKCQGAHCAPLLYRGRWLHRVHSTYYVDLYLWGQNSFHYDCSADGQNWEWVGPQVPV